MTEFTPEMMAAMKRLGEPGEGHARLGPLVGVWDTETHMYMAPGAEPIVTEGQAESRTTLGGRFLVEDLDGHGPDGAPYRGQSVLGFNNITGRYEGIWISDGMTPMTTYTGEMSEDGRTLVFAGTETDPTGTGPDRTFRMERVIQGPERNTLAMHYAMPDGTQMKSFEIVYTRRNANEAGD